MTLAALTSPFQPFVGLTGTGLNQGALYIGIAGMDPQTDPQDVWWDAGGTILASQPIAISGGYPMRSGTPAQLFTADTYSMRLRDKAGVQVFYIATASPPTGNAKIDFSNVANGVIDGDFTVQGVDDPNLFVVDHTLSQVSIGTGKPVNQFRKFTVIHASDNMAVDGETTGMSAIESRMDCTGFGTGAINPDGVYGTLWYHPTTADAHFTGAGAAIRGNAYTIDVAGIKADVDLLIGSYGRARHENVLGTVTYACSFFADGAQKGAGGGTITNAAAMIIPDNTQGTNNYGLLFTGSPANGCIAMAPFLDFVVSVNGVNAFKVLQGGNVIVSRNEPTNAVIIEIQNQSAGAAASASVTFATGTASTFSGMGVQDNAGNPYFLGTLGSALQGWFWNGPYVSWRDNSAVEYGRVTPSFFNHTTAYRVANTQVVAARRTGWTAATGTATRTTFDTTTVTLPQLAEHVKAMIDDLLAHGLIGA